MSVPRPGKPRWAQGPGHPPQNYSLGVPVPPKISDRSVVPFKSIFCMYRHTDTYVIWPLYHSGGNVFVHVCVGEVIHNSKPCKIYTISLSEALLTRITHEESINYYYPWIWARLRLVASPALVKEDHDPPRSLVWSVAGMKPISRAFSNSRSK